MVAWYMFFMEELLTPSCLRRVLYVDSINSLTDIFPFENLSHTYNHTMTCNLFYLHMQLNIQYRNPSIPDFHKDSDFNSKRLFIVHLACEFLQFPLLWRFPYILILHVTLCDTSANIPRFSARWSVATYN